MKMPEDEQMDLDHKPHKEPVKSIEGWIILVVNLHEETSEEDLQDKFADYGAIKNLHLNLDRRTGYVKGYAFIEYATKEQADAAIEDANGSTLLEQTIKVDYAFVAPPPTPKGETKPLATRQERDRSRSPIRYD